MKKLVAPVLFAIVLLSGFTFSESSHLMKTARFDWEAMEHDFGKIPQNIPVSHAFTFTNAGDAPLIISDVKGSCGCTVTDYTKDPIAPGKTGTVKATYNAKAMGQFHKSITVTANVEGGPERLYIKGEVIKSDNP